MNIRQTENRIARGFERLMETLLILVIAVTPVYGIWALGGLPVFPAA